MASSPARTLEDLLRDFQSTAARFDPTGEHGINLLNEIAQGCRPDELAGAYLAYFRLLKFERFLQREDGRIGAFPDQLRPIAAGEALDSLVQPDVLRHLQSRPPTGCWLERLCPFVTPPDAGRIRTLQGHERQVDAAAWSPDGRRLVSGSNDKTLIVWDASSGRILTRFPLESRPRAVAFHPVEPDRFVVGLANGWVRQFRFHEVARRSPYRK